MICPNFFIILTFVLHVQYIRHSISMIKNNYDDFTKKTINIVFRDISKFLNDVLKCMKLSNTHFETSTAAREIEMNRLKQYISSKYTINITQFVCWRDFCGPWTDEVWIKHFYHLPASDFGIFVPVFFNWFRYQDQNKRKKIHIYKAIIEDISSLLKPTFLYVTVSYFDGGIEAGLKAGVLPKNLFVVNAGGVGHMPILMRGIENHPNGTNYQTNFKYDLVFMGGAETNPIRPMLISGLSKIPNLSFFNGRGQNWREIFQESKAILCPRGYGRNSIRLTEVLEMGLIPIVVYNDIIYVPYYNSIKWEDFSLIVKSSPDAINKIADFVKNLSTEKTNTMRAKIRNMYNSHFSRNGSISQLKKFLKGGFSESDLRCAERLYYP